MMLENSFDINALIEKVRIPPDRLKPAEVRGLVLALVARAQKAYRSGCGSRDGFISQEVLQGIKPYGGYFEPQDRWKERRDIYD